MEHLHRPDRHDALFTELESVTGSIGDLQTTLTLAVYGGLIIGTIIFQGLNALYYFTRTKHVQAYSEA